jgi:HTH-type transcriptional regulator/antitoxin HipB
MLTVITVKRINKISCLTLKKEHVFMNITRPEQLSTLIKTYRKKHGVTQAEIAQLVGLRVATISDFENKPESCKLATFFKILAALQLQLDITSREHQSAADQNQWQEGW